MSERACRDRDRREADGRRTGLRVSRIVQICAGSLSSHVARVILLHDCELPAPRTSATHTAQGSARWAINVARVHGGGSGQLHPGVAGARAARASRNSMRSEYLGIYICMYHYVAMKFCDRERRGGRRPRHARQDRAPPDSQRAQGRLGVVYPGPAGA